MKKAIVLLVFSLFCIVPMQNAWAKSNIGLNRLGLEAGMVDPESAPSTLGVGLEADLGTIAPQFALSTRLGYWSQSQESFGATASISDISFGGRVKYLFEVAHSKVQPYVGGGLGLNFFHSKASVPALDLGGGLIIPGYTISDTVTKLGVDLGGGVSTPVSTKTNLFGELWYEMADIDQLTLQAGVSFALSK